MLYKLLILYALPVSNLILFHLQVLTGCHVEEEGGVSRWRVENSWGEDRGEKGYILMTTDWFKEFVFEIVVDRKHVPQEVGPFIFFKNK